MPRSAPHTQYKPETFTLLNILFFPPTHNTTNPPTIVIFASRPIFTRSHDIRIIYADKPIVSSVINTADDCWGGRRIVRLHDVIPVPVGVTWPGSANADAGIMNYKGDGGRRLLCTRNVFGRNFFPAVCKM